MNIEEVEDLMSLDLMLYENNDEVVVQYLPDTMNKSVKLQAVDLQYEWNVTSVVNSCQSQREDTE